MYEIVEAITYILESSLKSGRCILAITIKNPEVIIIFTKWMMSIGCYLAWDSLKLHLLRILNASKGVERNSFFNMHTMFPKYR